ncbi:PREDICTED: TBC1 domain family member 13 isoform X1 [Papilio xuthus]|uniref:TBC1 domain family member 13 n=1 Tax=Papilio xuthus TaxID=66420 RepID=A0AAJ6ZUY8_PAPXU|nr:PREDICTED: TBC1 domain family member 13 isoform X1 [Papilio xuthus]
MLNGLRNLANVSAWRSFDHDAYRFGAGYDLSEMDKCIEIIKGIKAFEEILEQDVIDIKELQKLAFNGVPDDKGLRSLVWRILLHYVPKEKSSRESTLFKKRQLYKQFIDEIIVSPGGPADHPLNISPDSSWSTYFKDNEVLLQIDKDVRRLCPDISFFQSATEFPCLEIVNSNGVKRLHKRVEQSVLKYSTLERRGLGVAKLSNEIRRSESITTGDYAPLNEGCEAHWEVVERMLFLYAKLNPGQGYVQGMNEIIGPIYHTFAIDANKEYREHAEADCFFCFTNLMAEIRDFFIRTLDEAESGINYMMSKLSECVKRNDRVVWDRMERQELRPQYYSFRWLTLLLSQEFSLPDVERFWDSLFADPHRFNFLIYICCAMILLVRDDLLSGDFASNVKLLQNFPPMDVSLILNKAVDISTR